MARPRRGAAQSRRVATVVALVVAVGLPSLGVLAADPPCELEADTLSGHEGATMHEYAAGTAKHNYCHLAHNCDGHLCVILDNEGCEIDCDVGYGDSSPGDTNQLYCNYPGTGDPVLQFDFTCTACDEQSYKAAKGNVACTPCPGGNGTGKTGATSADECSVCGPGEDGSPCRPCAVGTWKEVSGAGSCSLCPEGKTTASRGARRESQCSICTAGYGGAACDPCAVGRYKASNGTHECTPCPGRTSTSAPGAKAASDCDTCERGYEGPPSCQPVTCAASAPLGHHGGCPQGQYGGDDCTVTCATGYVAQAGSGLYTCNATDAGAGTWIPADGAETALACDEAPAARCPDSSAVFPIDPSSGCNTVHIVSVVSPDSAESGDIPRYKHWRQGLEVFRDRVNSQGGLRMGEGFVGYVNVTMHTVEEEAEQERHYRDLYLDLCQAADVDVMIGPLDSTIALNVLRHLTANHCNKLFLLASSGIDLVFTQGFTHAWSVYGKASQRGSDVIAFLDGLGDTSQSKTVAIAGESTELTREWLGSLTDAIDAIYDISVVNTPDLAVRLKHQIQLASEEKPTIFIGLGDAFESLLSEFKLLKYAPAAAFLAGGLDVSNYTAHQSCTRRKKDDCLVYDQWLGTVPWSPDMKHAAETDWSGKPDKYSDSTAGPGGGDRRYTRYMGSVSDFVELTKEKCTEPTHYHAQAAATLLMMQTAIELAPSAEGWGLTFDDFRNINDAAKVRDAMTANDVQTFWGPIQLHETGNNVAFKMGVAQLQEDSSDPVLVGPESFAPAGTVVFPAKWPCELRGSCELPPAAKPTPPFLDHIMNPTTTDALVLGGVLLALLVFLKCIGCKFSCGGGTKKELLPNEEQLRSDRGPPPWSIWTMWFIYMVTVMVAVLYERLQLNSHLAVSAFMLTVGTAIPVLWLVPQLKQRLDAPAPLPGYSQPAGAFGAMMSVVGLGGVALHVTFCVSMLHCEQGPPQYGLFGCAVFTSVLTMATTARLICCTRSKMLEDENVRAWYRDHGKQALAIMVLSASRLDAMSLLRLRIGQKDLVQCPMKTEHYQWIRYAGVYHCVMEDLAYMLLGGLKLTAHCNDSDDYNWVAIGRVVLSGLLIVIHVCDKYGQWQAHRENERGMHLRESMLPEQDIGDTMRGWSEIMAVESRQSRQRFTDSHVAELRPHNWKTQMVGKGSFGTVYKATWRERDVAIKELMLPEEPHKASAAAKDLLRKRVEGIQREFVKEAKTCRELSHPNIVLMLGWAIKPRLYLVQEFMGGLSLHSQLYIEGWCPTTTEVLKVAADVAKGMHYLHTAFDKPVIHRDLKSGNLMLVRQPAGEEVEVKITDFGLTREARAADATMAASTIAGPAGTVLWMAPELLLGEEYTEKVDVFSYAMCLVELVHRNLPWHESGVGQHVIPGWLTQGKRPEHQLPAHPALRQLIVECWAGDPADRPAFAEVMLLVEAAASDGASGSLVLVVEATGPLGHSRPASPDPMRSSGRRSKRN